MNPEKKYEELGKNYRFFLNWRHVLFGGFIFVMGALIIKTSSIVNDSPLIGSFIYMSASFLSLIFRALDNRTRDLYRAAMDEGKKLEEGITGFYTAVSKRTEKISHSDTLDVFYFTSAGLLIIASKILFIVSFIRFCKIAKTLFPDIPFD